MAINVFHAESALLRTIKITELKGEAASALYIDVARTYLYDTADRVNKSGRDAINAFAEGDEQRMMLLGVKRFTKADTYNTKEARRRIADKLIADNKYSL